MRSWWLEALRLGAVACALVATTVAWAHPDVPVADARFRLEPGAAESFPMAVHYHRVVGRLDTRGADAAGLEVLIVGKDAWLAHGDAAPADAADFVATGASTSILNHLVRCCNAGYADYRLIVRNRGASARDVELRAWAVHDDFAVVVDRAEAGAFGVPVTIFGALSGLALTFAARSRRRRRAGGGGAARARPNARATPPLRLGDPRLWRWSVALAATSGALALGLGVVGFLRYGGDPVTGMMAVLVDVPIPGGPFGSRAALVMGVLLLGWCGAVGTWIRTVAADHAGPVSSVGAALGAVSVAGGVAMGVAYGAAAVPAVLGLVLGVPLIAAAWLARPTGPALRRSIRSG